MLKNLSSTFAKILGFLVPPLLGVTFFFAIIGVFGLGIAVAGLLVAVIGAVVLVRRLPAEGDAR
jgi:hypothetical protein